jgi:choline dehydrogenase-like flavoprotein
MIYDFLIVGSGVAATALTERLLEKHPSASILILEAGDRVKTKDFAMWQEFLIKGPDEPPYLNCRDLNYPNPPASGGENEFSGSTKVELRGSRLFVYGGSTMEWGGWSPRLKPEDFSLRSNTGQGADWPFGYDALEKYYCQAERHLAVSGDSSDTTTVPRSAGYSFKHFPLTFQDKPVADAMDALEISYGHMPIARRGVSETPSRHAPCQTTGTCDYCPFGARYVASNYLDDLRTWNDCSGLEVRTNSVVETIETSSKMRAVSVTYKNRLTGERMPSVEADRIIIAAGAIESAKLLQRSKTAHWPRGIGNDSGHVGANFTTHPMVIFNSPAKLNRDGLQPELDFPTLISRHFDTKEQQALGKFVIIVPKDHVDVRLESRFRNGKRRPDIVRYLCEGSSGEGFIRKLLLYVETVSDKTNTIRNLEVENRFRLPQTGVHFSNDTLPGRLKEIAKIVSQIYRKMDIEVPDNYYDELKHILSSWGAHHAASTCRMSKESDDGVVDADLKVHGMDNLYVCSNAVFPSIGAVNPTLTLTALALRLGDHLSGNRVRSDA